MTLREKIDIRMNPKILTNEQLFNLHVSTVWNVISNKFLNCNCVYMDKYILNLKVIYTYDEHGSYIQSELTNTNTITKTYVNSVIAKNRLEKHFKEVIEELGKIAKTQGMQVCIKENIIGIYY